MMVQVSAAFIVAVNMICYLAGMLSVIVTVVVLNDLRRESDDKEKS